ncbi:MAG: hypothetical protein FJW96_09905 [Actinobacteria bacterium]|nr:hypothetical protein [Actinomycetota bacterium]
MGGGGLPFPIPTGRRAGGGGGLILLLVVGAFLLFGRGLFGGDGGTGIQPGLDGFGQAEEARPGQVPEGDTVAGLVGAVSKHAQDFWTTEFQQAGREYRRAKVVLFTGGTQTGCGPGSSATGPFYCPLDERVYIDLSFFRELSNRFGAPGDFAQAYVVSHEIAHHVQKVLGIEPQVRERQRSNPDEANDLSVRMELQADCFAGVWSHSVYLDTQSGQGNLALEEGDIEEGLNAAAAVGDDRLGARSPESWTHGSSELRVKWFKRGFESGQPGDCDTFSSGI